MANTTNFGWETPDDTDLVKDGAAAIRTLGSAIDTSLVDLKGGTTGQVLSKATNADMDFTWTNGGDITEVNAGVGITGGGTSGPVTITNSMADAITTKGDLIVGTGADTFARLAAGTNDYVLTAASGETTGLKWAAQTGRSASSWSLISSASLTGATTITVSGISNQEMVMVWFAGASSANAASFIRLQINGQTGNNYDVTYHNSVASSTYSANNNIVPSSGLSTYLPLARLSGSAGSASYGACFIYGANSTAQKPVQFFGSANADGSNAQEYYHGAGIFTQTGSKVTSISLVSSTGNFDSGTVYVWGTSN